MSRKALTSRKWFYPVIYGLLVILSMLPPITQVSYDPRNTQDVIMSILMVSIVPYEAWGWAFHVATIAVIALVIVRQDRRAGDGRLFWGQLSPHRRLADECGDREIRPNRAVATYNTQYAGRPGTPPIRQGVNR